MKRSIALVAAALALSLGLLASLPAEAGSKQGHGYKHGQQQGHKHSYGHSYGKGGKHGHNYAYRHGYRKGAKHAHRHGYKSGYRHGYRGGYGRSHDHRGFSDSTLLAAVGIAAGAEVISAYLQGPPAPQPAPVYVAPTYAVPVRQPVCTQVLVPYQHPYGGIYYAPQVQCY
jgi:hypothetical protein